MTGKTEQRRPTDAQMTALWRAYDAGEEARRTNAHYELDSRFFNVLTGGEWNVYSCNLWDGATSVTASQEQKLDVLAEMMGLRPGMRVLDVGSGWGGPLCYLARRYQTSGVGISPSAAQATHANLRARELGVPVEFHVADCFEFEDAERFDAIYSDEVIVHFDDLRRFFERIRLLLRPNGILVTKEAHFASSAYMAGNRLMVFINEIFGESGHYVTLHEELRQLDAAGWAVTRIASLPATDYTTTARHWALNLEQHRAELEPLVGPETFRRFRTYLRLVQRLFSSGTMTVDVIAARPVHPEDSPRDEESD